MTDQELRLSVDDATGLITIEFLRDGRVVAVKALDAGEARALAQEISEGADQARAGQPANVTTTATVVDPDALA